MQVSVSGSAVAPGATSATADTPSYPGTYDTPIPGAFGDGGYANIALAANKAYQDTLAQINAKRMGALRQAGYLGDVDPTTGQITNVRFDPNNPYGGLQQMLRSQAGDFTQAQYAAEDRGLHGGLAHKADSELKYQHGGQAADFGTAFANTLGGLAGEQSQAAYTRDAALAQAEQAAAEAAIQNQSFNPGDYTGLDYPDYGSDPGSNPPSAVPKTKAQTVAKKVIAKKTSSATAAARALAIRSKAMNKKYGLK